MIELRLCLALCKTRSELRELMTMDELQDWCAYISQHGLPTTRLEHSIAIAGSAICNTWGAKVEPKHLLPEREQHKMLNGKQARAAMVAWAAARNNNGGSST